MCGNVFKLFQLIDLRNFKNLLHDSCLIYNKIPERKLTKSDCYVSNKYIYIYIYTQSSKYLYRYHIHNILDQYAYYMAIIACMQIKCMFVNLFSHVNASIEWTLSSDQRTF